MKRYFITATGTEVGKTVVTTALAHAAVAAGHRTAALKPLETGVEPVALDATTLEAACERVGVAEQKGFYRAPLPLAPWAATLAGCEPPPAISELVTACAAAGAGCDVVLIEGAGGVLVPVTEDTDVVDLIRALGAPSILVAQDGLGVLSHTLTAYEALVARQVPVAAVVLGQHQIDEGDVSVASNASILRARLPCPVLTIGRVTDVASSVAAGDALWDGLSAAPSD